MGPHGPLHRQDNHFPKEYTVLDTLQARALLSYRRVEVWCAANPGLVPPAVGPSSAWVPLTRQLDVLHTVTTQMTAAALQQVVQAKQSTLEATGEPALRKDLRDELRVVTEVAQALRTTTPGIGTLKLPRSGMQTDALLRAADALSTQA